MTHSSAGPPLDELLGYLGAQINDAKQTLNHVIRDKIPAGRVPTVSEKIAIDSLLTGVVLQLEHAAKEIRERIDPMMKREGTALNPSRDDDFDDDEFLREGERMREQMHLSPASTLPGTLPSTRGFGR